MSFYFHKAALKQARQALAVPAGEVLRPAPASGRQNAPALWRLGCKACPLDKINCKTPKMAPTLVPNTKVYFLAEAPGRIEDENTGVPLTGPSGALLRSCIPGGLVRSICGFDNVCNCRPSDNRMPTWQEQECCRPRRIKFIEQAKPKLIVGLGAVPLQWALNSSDMQGMRGRLFTIKVGNHTCHFLSTYHPSFILRIAKNKRKPLNSMMGHCFRMDIQRAFDLVDDLQAPHVDSEQEIRAGVHCYDGSEDHHLDEVLDGLRRALKYNLAAIDLETKGLRPFSPGAAIMSVAVSYGTHNFAFALDHPQSKWNNNQREQILTALKVLITSSTTIKIAHNEPFELEWLVWLFGKEVVRHDVWEDTMVQAHVIDERRGKQARGEDDQRAAYQSLNFLCKQYFGVSYKPLFKLNKKDMSKSPIDQVLLYNGCDTKYTLRLFKHQDQILKKKRLHEVYLDALPRQASIALMQTIGIDVDQKVISDHQKLLGEEIDIINVEIKSLSVVSKYIADKGAFNPLSGPDVISIFRDYLGRKEVTIADGKGFRFSSDKNILDRIDHPLADLIVLLRNRTKLRSTYVDGLELGKGEMIYPDGKIHCNFNTTFTETGRTSSDTLNMQNFPQRNDAWIRKQIVPPKGHVLLAFDYGQLEACTAAMCSHDQALIKALWEDYDVHREWAERTAAKYPAAFNGDMKAFRSRIKNKLVFPSIFGAHNESISDYLSIPVEIIDDLMDEFWQTFSGLKRWQDATMKRYYEVGYVETPNGRRHHYPLTRNQAINHPVQGLAAEIVCDAMNRLSIQAAENNQWHLHPVLNIHDDLTVSVPDDDRVITDSIEAIYRIMLMPPYKCVNVPLSVKASIGKNWFEMDQIGSFWSNKDL